MTSRDRPGPETGTSSGKAVGTDGGSSPAVGHSVLPQASLWEAWYTAASPSQREQFLDQARQQGLLFTHQLPAPERLPSTSAASLALKDCLGKPSRALAPLAESPFEPIDRDLDEQQRQAVARALATTDLSLILGYPGTGKSRVLAELSRQALRQGWRTLIVSPDAPAIDRVLELFAGDPRREKMLRWLGEQESTAGVSASAAELTLAGRLHHYQHHTLASARRAAFESRASVEHWGRQVALWEQMGPLRQESARLEQAHSALLLERDNLASVLAAEMNGSGHAGDEASVRELASVQERLTALHAEGEKLHAEHRHCCEQREHLAPLVEAKEAHRWWTSAWWRATVSGLAATAPRSRLEELAVRCQQVDDRQQVLARDQAELESRAGELQRRLAVQREQYLSAESTRRRAALDQRLAEMGRARDQANSAWQSAVAQVEHAPAEFTADTLAQGRADAVNQLARSEGIAKQRQAWLAALEGASGAALAGEFLANARLVAATVSGLPAGPSPAFDDFDLVILDEAHRASEADVRSLAARAGKLVLVGEAEPDLPIAPPARPRSRPQRPNSNDKAESSPLPTPPFHRLWNALHPDPRRLPARCRHVNGRLVITMRPLPAEHHGWLQREQVFDRPEIELVIVSAPGLEPSVVEVVFPGSTTIADAKAFIHRELEEMPVHASGPQARWRESETAWSIDLSLASEGEPTVVQLAEGVREHVGRCPCQAGSGEVSWQTLSLEFDKSAGWDKARAEAWVEERLRLRDAGRTSVLAKGYRARPALTRFVSTMLHGGCLQTVREVGSTWSAARPAVQFFPVPTQPRTSPDAAPSTRRGGDPALRWNGSAPGAATATLASPSRGQPRQARGGAGLEVDLSDPRRIDALPNDLRGALPARGVVNFLEARAVIQTLEELVGDDELQAAWSAWRPAGGPAIAVVSPFPGQVELLRVLADRSGVLGGSPLPVEICLPQGLAQREALVVMLSLTRSHATRAVPFSDHPRDLLLALTRAAGRLLIFGDPGTMNRRSQWFGALDHMDETTGPVEQALIGELLAALPEHEGTAAPQARIYAGK